MNLKCISSMKLYCICMYCMFRVVWTQMQPVSKAFTSKGLMHSLHHRSFHPIYQLFFPSPHTALSLVWETTCTQADSLHKSLKADSKQPTLSVSCYLSLLKLIVMKRDLYRPFLIIVLKKYFSALNSKRNRRTCARADVINAKRRSCSE